MPEYSFVNGRTLTIDSNTVVVKDGGQEIFRGSIEEFNDAFKIIFMRQTTVDDIMSYIPNAVCYVLLEKDEELTEKPFEPDEMFEVKLSEMLFMMTQQEIEINIEEH